MRFDPGRNGDALSELECGSAANARRSTSDDRDATALESRVLGGVVRGEDLYKCSGRGRVKVKANEVRSGRLISKAGADCVGLPQLRVNLCVRVHDSERRNVTGAGHKFLSDGRQDDDGEEGTGFKWLA